MRESSGVLGQLYRDISNDNAMREFMNNQHRFQIKLQYALDYNILEKASSPEVLHSYLPEVFSVLVNPMEIALRQIMLTFKLQTEASLFASDLKFKLCDDSIGNHYKNDPGFKSDDSLILLNNKLN